MRRAVAILLGVCGLALVSGCGLGSGAPGGSMPPSRPAAGSRPAESSRSAAAMPKAAPARIGVSAGPAGPAGSGTDSRPPFTLETSASPPSARLADAAAPPIPPPARPFEPETPPGPPPSLPAPEPPRSRVAEIQSGTLTAGSFDDNERLEDYRRFLSDVMQQDPREKLPRLDLGRRAVIEVQNEQGEPIADARVTVRPLEQGGPRRESRSGDRGALLDVLTASDGRAMFLSGMDGGAAHEKFTLTVYPPDGSSPVSLTMDTSQESWKVRLSSAKARPVAGLDLALVIDTTGSMGDELEYLKVELDSIARSVRQMFPEVEQRYALVVYRDQGDQYVTRTFDFTGSLDEFRGTLSRQHASGGGDYPEAVHLALAEAGKLRWRKEGTARVLFLVGDAPPHEEYGHQTLAAVAGLRRQSVRVFPVAGSGTAQQAEFIFRAAAMLTQGQYLFLTDHSGVGNPHTPPQVPDYQVERLDRLMLRMIASELAGRRLAATEVLAIEGGQSPYLRPGPIVPGQEARFTAPPHAPERAQSASWLSRAAFPTSWLTHWSVLLGILVGKLVLDVASERRAAGVRRDFPA